MEFIAGETLGQLVYRKAPLTLSRRIALMEQVCVGLAYAHRHGIVHRDVKPANLMISRDSGVLKVLDFGVAGRVDADPGQQGQMLMGTPNYMSPEQVVGQASDHRSDIFSVGLVLYELLTYRQAFSGESQQSILLKVLNESPQPLAALVPGIDPALPAIVDRALEKSVDRRYPIWRRCGRTCRGSASASTRPRRRTTWSAGARSPPGVEGEPAGRRPAARRRSRRPAQAAEPGPEPRQEPTSELSPGLSPERSRGRGSSRTSRRRWPRPSVTPTRDASPPRSGGSRRSDRTPTSTPRCSTTAQTVAARDAGRAQGASRLITDVIRAHVGGVRAAISAGRWREAQELLRTLERDVPAPDDAGPHAGPARAAQDDGRPAEGVAEPEPRPMRRDDEVAHYLSRARRRLEAGDVTAAQSLLDAALDMTRTP